MFFFFFFPRDANVQRNLTGFGLPDLAVFNLIYIPLFSTRCFDRRLSGALITSVEVILQQTVGPPSVCRGSAAGHTSSAQ